MKIIHGLEKFAKPGKPLVLTIGNFDGVHLGHQKIFRAVREKKAELGGVSMALTFNPHPLKVIAPDRGVRLLCVHQRKVELIDSMGLDMLLLADFDRQFASIGPAEFIRDILVGLIGPEYVIVGHSYNFGKGKKGTTATLRQGGRKYGYGLQVVRSARLHGDTISSSRIRSLLSWGRVCEASLYLGRHFSISGTVVKGAGRGARLLGCPTANLETENEVIPKEGVYAVRVGVGKKLYDGVANIGRNPTFTSDGARLSIEAHIFDFSGELCGKTLRVYFVDRIRREEKFSGPESLKAAIASDIDRARLILGKKKTTEI